MKSFSLILSTMAIACFAPAMGNGIGLPATGIEVCDQHVTVAIRDLDFSPNDLNLGAEIICKHQKKIADGLSAAADAAPAECLEPINTIAKDVEDKECSGGDGVADAGLSTEAIVKITVGSLAVVGGGFALYYMYKKKAK
jgi:hypothetical protein